MVQSKPKHAVAAIASLFGTACVLSACGINSSAGQPTAKSSQHITITWLSHYNSFSQKFKQNLAKKFEKLHPNVTVKLITPQTGLVFAKYQALSAGGQAPDVYEMSSTYAAELFNDHALAPIDYKAMGVSNYQQLAAEYIPGILSAYQYHGALYGIPQEYANYQMWINAADFHAAGIFQLPTTWTQVIQDAAKLTKSQGGVVKADEISLPINFSEAEYLIIDAMARELGQPLFNNSGTKAYLTSPAAVKVFTTLQDLVQSGAFVPALNGTTPAFERNLYGENRSAILLDAGSWYAPTLQQSYPQVNKDSVVEPYPTFPGHASANDTYGYAFIVSKTAAHQSWDWKFVHFLQQQGPAYFKLGLYTGLKSLNSSPAAKSQPFWLSKWVPSMAQGHYMVSLIHGTQIFDFIGTAYDNIILKHANVQQTLASTQKEVEPLLNP